MSLGRGRPSLRVVGRLIDEELSEVVAEVLLFFGIFALSGMAMGSSKKSVDRMNRASLALKICGRVDG